MTELLDNVRAEIERQEREYRAYIESRKNDYTDRQRKIVEGKIPLYKETIAQLKIILRKAEIRGESERVDFIVKEVKAREKNLDSEQPYSDIQQMLIKSIKEREKSGIKLPDEETLSLDEDRYKQIAEGYRKTYNGYTQSLGKKVKHLRDAEYNQILKEETGIKTYTRKQKLILDGVIPLDSVRESDLTMLIRKAEALGDVDYVEKLEQLREEKLQSNQGHVDLTDVAAGKVPYEAITVSQLLALAKKAKQSGDIELYELIQILIIEKRNDYNEKHKIRPRNPFYRKYANATPQKYKFDESGAEAWAMDILESRLYPFNCEMMDLQDIMLYADTLEDPAYGQVARFLINERKDRSIVYAAQSKEDALQLINNNSWYPVKHPEDWDRESS